MLGLPLSTEIKKQIPKTQLSAKKGLKPEDRRLLDGNVSRLDLVNQISPKTIPALAAGEAVKSIFVLKATLKRKNYDPKAAQLILKLIPQKLILVLSFEGDSRLAVMHEKPLVSDWRSDSVWQNEASLVIRGADLDAVWISFKSQVSGIVLDNDVTEAAFTERLHAHEEEDRLRKRIAQLEKTCRAEIQPRRKFAIYTKILNLKNKLKQGT